MSAIEQGLADLMCAVFGVKPEELLPEKGRGTLRGWDSLRQLKLIMALEEEYGVELSQEEIESLNTVADVVRVMSARTR